MAYCTKCGAYAALDPAAMCAACRANWHPADDRPADLGFRSQYASERQIHGQSP